MPAGGAVRAVTAAARIGAGWCLGSVSPAEAGFAYGRGWQDA